MGKSTKEIVGEIAIALLALSAIIHLGVMLIRGSQEKRTQKMSTNPYYELVTQHKTVGLVEGVCVNVHYVSDMTNITVTPMPKELCQE